MKTISLALHGGAGTLIQGTMTPEQEAQYISALKAALDTGYILLTQGASALDAVEATVKSLEDCVLFNAGRGSVFTAQGNHEMDASIMDGKTRKAGAVSLVSCIKNPISLARCVMEKTEHVFMAGSGAMQFAQQQGFEIYPADYFYSDFRFQQWQQIKNTDSFQLDHSDKKDSKFGTVGAVALDSEGNLAAATSTGGMTNKKFGRVGDSPMIGAGNYANNHTCAVSCTGSGEYFIRGVVAYDVSCLMEYKGFTLQQAAEEVIMNRVHQLGGDGGLIAVDRFGNIAMPFNTEGMYRACKSMSGEELIAIYK